MPLKIVIPITEWKEQYLIAPWMVKIIPDKLNGLSIMSSADALQIRSVSVERFVKRIGAVNSEIIVQVEEAISQVLNL